MSLCILGKILQSLLALHSLHQCAKFHPNSTNIKASIKIWKLPITQIVP